MMLENKFRNYEFDSRQCHNIGAFVSSQVESACENTFESL